jgi:hypothetical protein
MVRGGIVVEKCNVEDPADAELQETKRIVKTSKKKKVIYIKRDIEDELESEEE